MTRSGHDVEQLLSEQLAYYSARAPEYTETAFPELAREGRLRALRHDGVWLTVNTPKDLRRAAEFMEEHPDWKPQRVVA